VPDLRRIGWAIAGGATVITVMAGVALASRVEVGGAASGSELRLALRATRARLEICRERSDEELASLPAHFRLREECEEVAVDYRLTVAVDGESRFDRVVSHRGVRRTRPLAVDESFALPAGRHRIDLAFSPEEPAALVGEGAAEHGGRQVDEERGDGTEPLRAAFAALPSPRFSATIDFAAGRAELLVLDEGVAFRRAAFAPGERRQEHGGEEDRAAEPDRRRDDVQRDDGEIEGAHPEGAADRPR
jgi:hypothetical protein